MKTLPSPQSAASLLPHAALSFRATSWCLVLGMALAAPLGLIVSGLPLPSPDADMIRVNAARMAPLHTQPWLLALHALIIAPLWEECVYRGLIQQMLRRYLPLWLSVVVPTFLFAGMHFAFSYQNAVFAAIVGLVCSWLVLSGRSLFACMLCHAGVNLMAVFVLRPLAERFGWNSTHEMPIAIILTLMTVSLGALVAAVRALRAEFAPKELVIATSPALSFA